MLPDPAKNRRSSIIVLQNDFLNTGANYTKSIQCIHIPVETTTKLLSTSCDIPDTAGSESLKNLMSSNQLSMEQLAKTMIMPYRRKDKIPISECIWWLVP